MVSFAGSFSIQARITLYETFFNNYDTFDGFDFPFYYMVIDDLARKCVLFQFSSCLPKREKRQILPPLEYSVRSFGYPSGLLGDMWFRFLPEFPARANFAGLSRWRARSNYSRHL